ncbi:2-C-methyl-D-erythritol 4-phosphate cytidylyltransferase [Pontibacter ummariensis]|uniref:2-C-methyl-D-erythritol 4-phosphate cytidylyltransferase n=1 Tax=Pontibacter ummariensis TaxID=1610492 RepID=A0A239GYH2_9BACT|nr:2-C-methyl-D-erythritol 4-phosphate cytidylyltransferase [Pontibacter ummariensis]PRY10965.1 2-C-methyl-D-erythritol 4-phosphate cytidylyltransferase [Pontibacter ummariensis]SNS74180.1 2-C-methyl-D-erythritol 4-phosphate cytidylyltransferase [Pontibacter ummariensis]
MATVPEYAIIVAGGSGSRMQQELPKQFIEVAGKPILMHTIERFYAYNPEVRLIVVLPQQQLSVWRDLCRKHDFKLFHMTVPGGSTRFGSVKNGLDAVQGEALVAVHDGVRPFIDVATIRAAFEAASVHGNAVVAVSPKDSIRELTPEGSQAVPRDRYKLVQTPQCFKANILKRAYEQPEEEYFTDDASVVEQTGEKIVLVEGSYRNIKITTPEDLILAEAFAR